VLVVDDEPLNLLIIEEFLDGAALRLVMTANAHQAWAELQGAPERFSAVLLDRMMPDLDGIELLRRIKRDAQLAHIPVIFQSASAKQSEVDDGMREGAFAYLTKPFSPEALRSVLARATSGHASDSTDSTLR
jgi:CheY-like chemotaxis protein